MNWLKDFIWGTFHDRNKGIRWYRWPLLGFDFANIRSKRYKFDQVD